MPCSSGQRADVYKRQLLAFVERASKEAASETEVEVLPQVASVLVEIIKLTV